MRAALDTRSGLFCFLIQTFFTWAVSYRVNPQDQVPAKHI